MKYVLITLSGGIIDQVVFYNETREAVGNLSEYVRTMNPDKNDAAVFGPNGLIANAKVFLDEHDQYIGDSSRNKVVHIIANPYHSLGFLVMTPTEPIGFTDPAKALSILEKMRKEHGVHVNLYRAELVKEPVISRKDLERFITDQGIKDFEYSLVCEYLK